MHARRIGMIVSGLVVAVFCGTTAAFSAERPQSWKPAFHDADELYDAAEDLHDRSLRLRDPRVIPLTAELETLTAHLYQLLKHNACAADVVPLMQTIGTLLDEATTLITLSCEMRTDRKTLSELENARRYFAATSEHIHCILHHHGPMAGVPLPHGAAVHVQPSFFAQNSVEPPPRPGRSLARVRITQIHTR